MAKVKAKTKVSNKKDTKVKVKKVAKAAKPESNPLADFMSASVDATEKSLQLVSQTTHSAKLSTGCLVYDLVNGGAIYPGMYTSAGPEQSAKSTIAISVLRSAIKQKVPIVMYFNAEGTLDPEYSARLFGVSSMARIVGERDAQGNWIVRPKLRYYTENVIEKVYKTIQRVLNALPDKQYLPERGKWYLIFDRSKDSQTMIKALGLTADAKLYSRTGMYYCETQDDNLQLVAVIDSYPSLITRAIQEEEQEGNGMAEDARAYSKWVKRVNGLLKPKGALLWGVNQVRQNPGARFQNPEYEPCGQALQFYSANRCRMNKRAVSGVSVGPGAWSEVEKSITTSGEDTYQYKHVKNVKNKYGSPQLEGWIRIWTADGEAKGHGIDPVFDTFAYLQMTGQIVGDRKKGFRVVFKTKSKEILKDSLLGKLSKVVFTWENFKKAVLIEVGRLDKKESGKVPLTNIRAECAKQLRSGYATELFAIMRNDGSDDDLDDLED